MTKETPKRPSADNTRKVILNAARDLFVKKGFAGTSISEIAKQAKVNQSLIYHHYANKESLWTAVKRDVMGRFAEEYGVAFEDILTLQDPKLVIEKMVRYRFELYDKFPELRRIIDWQFLESNPYELRGINTELLNLLIALIENFQNQNKIIPYYPADMITLYIFHTPVGFFKGFKDMSEGFTGDALIKRKEDYIQLCIDSLVKSLLI